MLWNEQGRAPSTTEVAFRIAPRINAAGRMDVAKDVVELFTVKDPARAKELAAEAGPVELGAAAGGAAHLGGGAAAGGRER